MANSVSGQDEQNPALWFATLAGKMELYCPLGITPCVPQKKKKRKKISEKESPVHRFFLVCAVKEIFRDS